MANRHLKLWKVKIEISLLHKIFHIYVNIVDVLQGNRNLYLIISKKKIHTLECT